MSFSSFPICTSENGTNCYFSEGESGVTFESGNAPDLSKKISFPARNPARVRQMGAKAQSEVAERASSTAFLSQFSLLVD